MKVLVVGASGATGRQLVNQLLIQGNEVKVIVRSTQNISESWKDNTKVQIITASVLELSVTDATRRLCKAIKSNKPNRPVKYVLMNTSGNSNRDLKEPISFAQKCVIGLLRLLLPPHVDNEKAADYLRTVMGQNDKHIEWVAVRPDGLIDKNEVTEYEIYPSPIRSAIFNAGKVSRINVAHFMASLITDESLWNTWKGQMPVIYSSSL